MPETAFEERTEGLSSAEKKLLGFTGTGGTFKIEKETQDDLVLRHHDGTVELRQLKGADGTALVALEQINGPDDRQPDYSFALDWDGFGFAVEREKHGY